MKTSIPYIINIVLLVVIILLFNRMNQFRDASQNKDSIISEKNDSISYYKNDRGQIIAEKIAAQATAKELAAAYPQVVKELKEDFDIKMKNLKAFVQNEIKAQGSGNSVVHNHYTTDSTGKRYPYWELKATDGYLDFRASVFDSLNAPYQYVYHDTITTVISSRKKNWFAKEKLYASTSLRNPNAKSVSSTNLLVDSYKDKRWVVYVGVGYGSTFGKDYILSGVTINVGVGRAILKL